MSFNLDDFFKSIDVIVEQRLTDLSYDTTVIATITDDSDKARGHYIVSDGTITFDAYVNDTNYKSGDQVRVSIMNGDWSQKKFIVGLYSENATDGALTYIPPLGNVFSTDFSTNTVSDLNSNNSFTLDTNGSETIKQVWGKQITKDSSEYALQANGVYNVITISGDFQTKFDASAGGYGLRLELYSKVDVDSNERIMKFVTFDSSEMIGNPYSFVIDSRQEKQIAIATQGIIDEIVLSIYQGVQFDDNGVETPNRFLDKDDNEIGLNAIQFKNLSIGFGSNLTEIEDNSLKFYTLDSATYKYNGGSGDETNDKRLGLVWYNKNELDGYVGYSDGVYDPNYDEIKYLQFAHTDSRLTRNSGKSTIADDELSLTLAANIEESEPYMTGVYKALTTDLSSELQALGRQITGWEDLKEWLNQLIASYVTEDVNGNDVTVSAKLVQARNTAETATQNQATLYAKVLQHGYNLQNEVYKNTTERNEVVTKITEWFNDEDGCNGDDPYKTFALAVDTAKAEVRALFTAMEEQTRSDQPMAGYRSIYNNYNTRVERVIKEIDTNLSKIIVTSTVRGITKDDFEWFEYYRDNTSAEDYPAYEKDEEAFAEYANKYCVYLYRYVELPTLEYNEDEDPDSDNNTEYTFGRFLGPNWERVKYSKDETNSDIEVINPFLPGKGETVIITEKDENDEDVTRTVTYNKTSSPSEILLKLRMEPTKENEKFQVVLFYNHEKFLSNTLVFTNLEADDIPPQFSIDANDIIKIEHGAYSQDHYQAYSQANDLVNIVDESRRRMIVGSYEGALHKDEALAGAEIYWYIPVNSTMLTYDKTYLVDELGFFTDDNGATDYSKIGYIYFNKTIAYTNEPVQSTDANGNLLYDCLGNPVMEDNIIIEPQDKYFSYKIKPYYEPSAQNNTILVEAHIKDSDNKVNVVKGELPLTFSSFGTNGTNYTLSMVPNTTQIASLPPTFTNEEGQEEANPLLQLKVTLRNGDGELIALNEDSFIFPNTTEEENKLEDAPDEEVTTTNFKYGWYALNGNNSAVSLVPAVEGSKEQLLEISPEYGSIPYVGIVKTSVEYPEELSDGSSRVLRLNTVYPIPYSSSKDYYISGPTTIVYDNQGVVSRCSDEPYKLFQHTTEGDIEETNCSWSIEYFEDNGTLLDENDTEAGNNYTNIIDYMPKLDYRKNTLLPTPMYYEFDNGTFIVPVIICKIGDKTVWTQPIIITQNNYASSTLNQWSGEFEINEANGTIMSTMVGAGKKNENNTFDGVLMGNIERGASFDTNNASGLGIYGFNNGAQSFYMGINGKAFFGKSGRGRIYIDGDQGTIASASYLQNKDENNDGTFANYRTPVTNASGDIVGYNIYNSAGMLIDLDDGFIDIKGATYQDIGNGTYKPSTTLYTEDEWNALPADSDFKKDLADYDAYLAKYDDDGIYIKSYKQSKIHIDALSPYFRIRSAQQSDENKYLIEIADDEYYLQTDDYASTTFPTADDKPATDGKGFKLDLKEGTLDAYKLKLTSKNLFINSIDSTQPYFVIKNDKGRNLMYVDNTNYYLQSADYTPMGDDSLGKGMKLVLAGGTTGIISYNFDLRAGNTGYGDHEIILSDSGNPYFMVNTAYNNATKTLVHISTTEQSLQSADYDATSKTGIRLSLSGKELKAYSGFTLQAYKGSQYVLLDATATDYPLRVYGSEDKQFRVNWDGGMYATGAEIKGTVNATSGSFNGTITAIDGKIGGWVIGSTTLTGGAVELNSGGSITIKDVNTFHVNSDGKLTCNSATIGGWNVTSSTGGFSNGNTYVSSAGIGYNSKKFYVDEEGNLFATSAVFDTNLTVKGSRNGSTVMSVDKNGNIDLNGKISIKGNYIYLNSAGDTSGNYLYTSGDNFYVKNASYIYLDANYVKVGNANAGIGIGGNPAANPGVTIIYGKIQINSPEDLVLMNADGKTVVTLANYIKNIGDFDTSTVSANAYFLVTSDGKKTKLNIGSDSKPVYFSEGVPVECDSLYAPTTQGSDGYVWMGNGTTTAPSWKSLTGFTTNATNRNYKINKDTSDNFYVNVPWTDTTYTFEGSGATTVSVSGTKVTISSTDTNTHPSQVSKAENVYMYSAARGYALTGPGGGYYSPGYTAYSTITGSSSRRFKHDIGKYELPQDLLYRLEPTSFIFNEDMCQGSEIRYGFIAEDVLEFAPQLVAKDLENPELCSAVHYNSILTLAVAEIQKLRKELDKLKSNL